MFNKQRSSRKNYLFFRVSFCILLTGTMMLGCQSQITTEEPTKAIPSTLATATITPSPVPTATPTLIYQPGSISFENSGEWQFTKPYVFEDWPKLIVPDGDAFRLIDDYKIQSIELSYQWWGLGDPVFNYQRIQKSGNVYKLAGFVVPDEKINSLIESMKSLHSVPLALSSTTHTDDYPIWSIEITGEDGSRILLDSTSNAPLYAPWNIIYNGNIYAQYDGAIATALAELFTVEEGQPMAAFFPGGSEEGKMFVNSNGLPDQLNYGFLGLLPLHTAFNYWTDASVGEIAGVVDGRSSIGGFGNMIIGSITKLEKIVVQKAGGDKVNCPVEKLDNEYDPSAVQWSFVCSVERPGVSGPYQYSIKVSFGTDKGERIISEGILFGDWNRGILIPQATFPPEIQNALAEYEPYTELRKSHEILLLGFDAEVDPVKGRLDDAVNADIVLLGQLRIEGRIIPYSLTTSIGIENGKVVRWDVDSRELQTLLTDVLQQPLAKNILNNDKDTILNLYYYESSKGAGVEYSEGSTFSGRNSTKVTSCEGIPGRKDLPDEDTAMRGFSFNGRWNSNPQFVLLDDTIRVLFFRYSDSYPLMTALVPEQLKLNGRPTLEINGSFDWGPYIQLAFTPEMTQDDKDAYLEMIKQLPGNKEYFDWGVSIDDAVFVVNEKGTLDLVECKKNN